MSNDPLKPSHAAQCERACGALRGDAGALVTIPMASLRAGGAERAEVHAA